MKLTLALFDGYTALDAVGGYEVLSRIPGMDVEFVASQPGTVASDTRQLGIVSLRGLQDVGSTDILYIPGGPGVASMAQDPAFLAWIRAMDATCTWTVGICNGVGLLAAAGVLKGRSATTNFFFRERLAAYGVEVLPKRFHQDGKYVTGAGVSASIDTALFLAQLMGGDAMAQVIGLGIEYYPAPPYRQTAPEQVAAPLVEMVRAYEAISMTLLAKDPPFGAVVR